MSNLERNENFSGFSLVNSTLAPTCVLFICIIIMIVFSTTTPIAKPRPVVWGTEASVTFLSMIVTFVIWFSVKRNRQHFLTNQCRKDVTLNIKLIVFWAFGLINMFNSALNMGANIDCLLTNGQQPFPLSHVLSILTHLTEIFFCVGQLGFLSFYSRFCFKPSSLINYGVSLMIIAHLLRWFRLLFDSILRSDYVTWVSLNSNTNLQEDCFYFSDIASVRSSLDPYISPMITEYSLLSAALVVRMCVNVFSDSSVRTSPMEEEPRSNSEETSTTEEPSSSEMLTRRTTTFVSLTSGVVLSLPLLISYLYSSSNKNDSSNIFRIISTVYEIQLLALLFWVKWKFKCQFYEISGKQTMSWGYQTIMVFVTSGTVCYETFGGIAGLMNSKEPSGLLLFINKILQTLVVIIQAMIILDMKNISFRPRSIRVKYFRVNRIFLCIFTMNILRWLVDSIAMGNPADATIRQRQFYGHMYWRTIEHTVFPINVFYRFLTAIEMYELYSNTNH